MLEKIYLDALTQDGVSVKKQNVDNEESPLGYPWRKAYINNTTGRIEVSNEISEPFLSQIMAIWGSTPTIETEPYIEPLPMPPTAEERLSAIEEVMMMLI